MPSARDRDVKRDIAIGNSAEHFICYILARAEIDAKTAEDKGKCPDYDIEASLNRRVFTIEAKYDIYEARSGNVAIEFYNPKSGRPSGIDATKADLWVHVLAKPMTAWAVHTDRLRQYVKENKPLRVVTCGGDDNASMYLYRREKIFTDIFERLDGLSPASLRELLENLLGGRSPGNRNSSCCGGS